MSNLFKRTTDILSASINDMLDRVENPESLIKQMVREMEDNLARAREQVIDAVTSEKLLHKQLEQNKLQSAQWLGKAEQLLKNSNEKAAREALEYKRKHDDTAESLETSWQAARTTSNKLKEQLTVLEQKLEEARRKQVALITRHKGAEAAQYLDKVNASLTSNFDAEATFARMEDKVTEMEARTEALAEVSASEASIETEIQQTERNAAVEVELAALREKISAG